ncbi:MAG: amino acid ABC transporter permease, partial [Mesorhizobium sp.]
VLLLFMAFNMSGTSFAELMRPVIGEPSVSGLYGRFAIAFAIAVIFTLNVVLIGFAPLKFQIGIVWLELLLLFIAFYTSFFRGLPLLMQVYLIYLGLPQLGFVINAVPAGILALSLCYGAYMTEIFRSGIQSIDRGQWEASRSMGFGFALTMRRIILPQALPVIIPPTGNQFISMLKDSSLVSV